MDPTGDEPMARTNLSRVLDPPVPVQRETELGTSMDAILDAAIDDGAVVYSPGAGGCIMHHYEQDDVVIAVYERCAGSHRRLFVFGPGSDSRDWAEGNWNRIYGDYNDDGLVDAWYSPIEGVLVEDDNGDSITDRMTLDHLDVEAMDLDSFNEDWRPPAYVESRILWDTDFDHFYDLETVMAGVDPDGKQTHWIER